MSFSPEWEVWYQTHDPIEGWYPALAKLIGTYVTEADKVLELGSGSGGNIPLILSKGWGYYGIEGSETAVRSLRERHPKANIIQGDFTALESASPEYDLVIDRAAIAHNDMDGIQRAIDYAWESLKPGGLFISSDWFSTNHSEARSSTLEDMIFVERRDFLDGQFAEVGLVHFSTERDLLYSFNRFDRLFIQERITRRPKPNFAPPNDPRHISPAFKDVDYQSAVWDIVVRKPYATT